jgi:hypothetical protein
MKIKFKNKRVIYNLVLSTFYIAIGLEKILNQENARWTKYIFFILGLTYLVTSLFEINNQYLSIENGIIKKNIILGYNKKINLKDIIAIKSFAGEYTLVTQTNKLKINTELIDPNSIEELYTVLKDLNLPADKTPFH